MKYTPNDHRTKASQVAGSRIIGLCNVEGTRVLSLGGGPFRIHPKIITLNIKAFDGVDVVGDAHRLPLATASMDAVHCEAVFEHLRDPDIAAHEMHRVMKPGALAFICTPFMQPFHGYPSHFQNYTLFGHRRLFERAGFEVLESGSCVGPSWAIAHIVTFYIAQYAPRWLRWPARAAWWAFARLLIRPLDRWLSERDDAYVLASTTYVLVSKPQ
jgi:SAM-dependent methyltransferase